MVKQKQKISLAKIKAALKANGMHLFPDDPLSPKDKEYISGFYSAKMGNATQEKEALIRRNLVAKLLRLDGFQVWTEPRSHMGGTDTCEFYLSAARGR
jgi:hypothetical protein